MLRLGDIETGVEAIKAALDNAPMVAGQYDLLARTYTAIGFYFLEQGDRSRMSEWFAEVPAVRDLLDACHGRL